MFLLTIFLQIIYFRRPLLTDISGHYSLQIFLQVYSNIFQDTIICHLSTDIFTFFSPRHQYLQILSILTFLMETIALEIFLKIFSMFSRHHYHFITVISTDIFLFFSRQHYYHQILTQIFTKTNFWLCQILLQLILFTHLFNTSQNTSDIVITFWKVWCLILFLWLSSKL